MAPKAVKPPRVKCLPITQARHHLGAVVKKIHLDKEYVILEKDGIPIVGMMDIDEFEDYLELQDPKVREHIQKSQEDYLAGRTFPAEDLIPELEREAAKARKKNSRARRPRA